ncbi:HAD family hydrolase [Psychroserpens sp. XS_ASV72]|uniref:HAD family hydrolase n=1 Tax=Psychroserpens sp. XS_ASV72 TaxID=3241293 RepID=UPI0035120EB2
MKLKSIIFDFGDVFINLDKQGAMDNALQLFELDTFPEELIAINTLYEQGLISTEEFLTFYTENFPELNKNQIIDAWNYILKDFPIGRLEFLKQLKSNHDLQLILLSNTNELHIDWVKQHVAFYEEFKSVFDAFYLSHEIQLRKPNKDIFEFVLDQNQLKPQECLFVDDTKENTDTAERMGIHVWNIDETKEDIRSLFYIKKELF